MKDVGGEALTRRGLLASTSMLAVGTAGAAAQEGETHTVDVTDSPLAFDPETITIAPGDTVEWVNQGAIDHSVTAYEADIPEEAAYFASGGFETEDAARSGWGNGEGHIAGGETYSHTFEIEGTYEYFCIPHETAGMVGTVEVSESGGGGGEGGFESPVTDAFKTVGVATVGAIFAVLIMAYTFLKYGGLEEQSGHE